MLVSSVLAACSGGGADGTSDGSAVTDAQTEAEAPYPTENDNFAAVPLSLALPDASVRITPKDDIAGV